MKSGFRKVAAAQSETGSRKVAAAQSETGFRKVAATQGECRLLILLTTTDEDWLPKGCCRLLCILKLSEKYVTSIVFFSLSCLNVAEILEEE
jgi:hypothetical protein